MKITPYPLLLLASVFRLAYADCSDLGQSITFSRMCYDNTISCTQTYGTLTGNLCTGGGKFTTTLAGYNCNSATSRLTVTSSNCILNPATESCSSNTANFKTATVSAVYLFQPVSSTCYNPLNQVLTMYEVIVFQTGTVNGLVATLVSPTTTTIATTTTTAPSPTSTPAPASSDNTVVIIVAVVAGLILLVVIVVAFIILRRYKDRNAAQSNQQPFIQQQYQPQPRDAKAASMIYPPYNPNQYSSPTSPTFPQNQMHPELQAAMLSPITTQGPALPLK
ncbi:hypothetical protein HK098_002007 [Nowakowskiella sp. JEL0407]|nr:hypothetical protein HK098_002007 [Nowakowskiella sp. JEL0407]